MLHGILSILLALCLGVLCPLNCQGAFHIAESAPVAACCPACTHHAPAGEVPNDRPAPEQNSGTPAGSCICSGAVSAERVDVELPSELASCLLPVPVLNQEQPALWDAMGFTPIRRNTGPVPLHCLLSVFLC